MRRRLPPPWVLTALLALIYLAVAPATTDLAAQEHRIALGRDGVWLYDLSWFGGHHLPSYSVLLPALGLVLGATVISGLAAVVAAWAFTRLTVQLRPGRGATVAAWWFAAGVGGLLFTGRVTFVLGVAIALLTLVVATRPTLRASADDGDDRGAGTGQDATDADLYRQAVSMCISRTGVALRLAGAVVGAVLTALASPVAALFLALVGLTWGLTAPGRRVLPLTLAGSALLAAGLLAAAFPGGGSEPFVASALWPAVAVLALALLVLPREERTLRVGVLLYLVAILLSGLLSTPMGGNATRLAALAGGPLVALVLLGRPLPPGSAALRGNPWLLAATALSVALLYWQWYPPVRDSVQALGDPSATASAWQPLRNQLHQRLEEAPARVAVVPTARRGEVRWLPPSVPLARGWIRQLDRHRNPLFYDDQPLTADRYRRWLDENAVGWVALPNAPLDHASRAEAALLRTGRVPGLRVVWRHAGTTLWQVERPRPLATGARTVALGPDYVVLAVPRAGSVDLRIRWSPYLRITAGDACLTRGPNDWTHIRAAAPGTVTVGVAVAAPWRRPAPADCDL